ncbi:hypothetical protein L1049_008933 [Liquidambar formosana]|uniref:Uncharacterized protein n=1 Tax=Liquidambar formosana TaxID=63359 RepID=A0AAP0N3C5_LIQFO
MENAVVQHVTKSSSDELLRKFAELGPDSNEKALARKVLRVSKRRKKCRTTGEVENCESPSNSSSSLVEKRSLLPPATRRSAVLLRRLCIGRSQLRGRDFRNKSLLGTIEKTWRKTVEGASKVFMEKHYNRHKRLINDPV